MKKVILVGMAICVSLIFALPAFCAEHGGDTMDTKEHGGMEQGAMEHGGTKMTEPSANEIRDTMSAYVSEMSKETGSFKIYDAAAGKTRKLQLVRIHERVGKTGDYYYSCADFKDMDTGETLDLDLDIAHGNGRLSVVDVRIHKVDGKERYTYDKNDNRIPVKK